MPVCAAMYSLPRPMRKLISISFLLLAAGSLAGQVITTPEERDALLDGMSDTLSNVDRATGDYGQLESPFAARMPELPDPADLVTEVVQRPKVTSPVLPDKQALALISQQFRPEGSLVMGNRGILRLSGGGTIEEGRTFRAEIKGNFYDVTVIEVTSKGYTLGLGEARVTGNFLTTTGTAQ